MTVSALAAVGELYYLRGVHPLSTELAKMWLAVIPTVVVGAGVVRLVPNRLAAAVILPVVVLVTYLLCVRMLGGFAAADLEIAAAIDRRIGYRILQSTLFSERLS
jgi:hypothetical protein